MSRRRTGVNLRSRLLCPICNEVKPVIAIEELVTLSCRHTRTEKTLPLRRGHISIENMRSEAAQRLFPATRVDEATSQPPWEDLLPCR